MVSWTKHMESVEEIFIKLLLWEILIYDIERNCNYFAKHSYCYEHISSNNCLNKHYHNDYNFSREVRRSFSIPFFLKIYIFWYTKKINPVFFYHEIYKVYLKSILRGFIHLIKREVSNTSILIRIFLQYLWGIK